MMMSYTAMPTVAEMIADLRARRERDQSFECPYCEHRPNMDEGDVYGSVTSMWGDHPHNYSCEECGEDYIVDEIVTRSYSSRKIGDPK